LLRVGGGSFHGKAEEAAVGGGTDLQYADDGHGV